MTDKALAPAAYMAALKARDLDAIVALYADDAVVEDPIGTPPHVGIEAIREFYKGAVGMPIEPELQGPVRIAGDEVAFAFRIGMPDVGMTIDIIDTFKFNDAGKIVLMRAFWGPENITN
ncbi:Steroid Delta-isomerase [Sinobacterium norvegicum]|uniref:Steroid Delta-isomerase n=1 Tax=Sinobacterium norvegicum TaxID=1641715 RepID=A0ABM9AGQ6_9GAMM|nr:nuclear transport factor 2 family protein [Sinobacterium norvegicum]CAH0992388.1 Steroid Delta-isomerase [Sinobacterium norvegicum]